jgi:pantoate--beta-alanine ligase
MTPADPLVLTRAGELRGFAEASRAAGRRTALVPTMGALHDGHLSLVRLARSRADRVMVSVFVNPTQFGPREDFARYPRDLEGDVDKLRTAGADVVFAPSAAEMYAPGEATRVEVAGLCEGLCGRERPGHFRGVATVVAKLLQLARPHVVVFGEKDWQQLAVIRRMVRDLCFDVEVLGAPIVREPDGLAMSSRNAYLSEEARRQAPALNAALLEARRLFRAGERDARRLAACARARLEKEPLASVEYVEVCCPDTLAPLETVAGRALLALAVRFGTTRLIDNALLAEEE